MFSGLVARFDRGRFDSLWSGSQTPTWVSSLSVTRKRPPMKRPLQESSRSSNEDRCHVAAWASPSTHRPSGLAPGLVRIESAWQTDQFTPRACSPFGRSLTLAVLCRSLDTERRASAKRFNV
jgi:hypothetical protein